MFRIIYQIRNSKHIIGPSFDQAINEHITYKKITIHFAKQTCFQKDCKKNKMYVTKRNNFQKKIYIKSFISQ